MRAQFFRGQIRHVAQVDVLVVVGRLRQVEVEPDRELELRELGMGGLHTHHQQHGSISAPARPNCAGLHLYLGTMHHHQLGTNSTTDTKYTIARICKLGVFRTVTRVVARVSFACLRAFCRPWLQRLIGPWLQSCAGVLAGNGSANN